MSVWFYEMANGSKFNHGGSIYTKVNDMLCRDCIGRDVEVYGNFLIRP